MDLIEIGKIFATEPSVKLAYLFGSRARGDFSKTSDYDFAVYLVPFAQKEAIKTKTRLLSILTKYLKTDDVDLLILNNSDKTELSFEVINDGKIILEKEPSRVILEPRIMNEYFDYKAGLQRYGLTKS